MSTAYTYSVIIDIFMLEGMWHFVYNLVGKKVAFVDNVVDFLDEINIWALLEKINGDDIVWDNLATPKDM